MTNTGDCKNVPDQKNNLIPNQTEWLSFAFCKNIYLLHKNLFSVEI